MSAASKACQQLVQQGIAARELLFCFVKMHFLVHFFFFGAWSSDMASACWGLSSTSRPSGKQQLLLLLRAQCQYLYFCKHVSS
jgi:hypothetical protein